MCLYVCLLVIASLVYQRKRCSCVRHSRDGAKLGRRKKYTGTCDINTAISRSEFVTIFLLASDLATPPPRSPSLPHDYITCLHLLFPTLFISFKGHTIDLNHYSLYDPFPYLPALFISSKVVDSPGGRSMSEAPIRTFLHSIDTDRRVRI